MLSPCHVFLVRLWRHGVSLPGHHIHCPIRGYISFGGLICCLAVLMIAEANWQYASSISEVFGSRSFDNNVQVSLVKSSQCAFRKFQRRIGALGVRLMRASCVIIDGRC